MSEVDSLIKQISSKLQERAEKITKPKEEPKTVNEQNFSDIISKNKIVVLDFWAPWCAPCHLYEPTFNRVASKYSNTAFFGRINVDENQKLADQYGVLNIPTTLIIVNGEVKETLVGAIDANTLESALGKYI
ncbi:MULTISPECIES: thioredoxin [Acidianus]|uniref:Thioredoxin n=1 Tax=Candidatus Acidianus copahuensis TaxID=1160895 RepID=A0A031LPH7_9CREN|nr:MULTISPECIES: thioredoxin [Acidianus]EZQ06886.1 thioredoxin [Candidatus Acidianus copahuensis]NON62855.1 thioredoxin [Acidianus sp. RZ1]